jgi:hypothetical protein
MAKIRQNFYQKIRKTLYTFRFADFLIHIAGGKLVRFSPAILLIPVRTRKIGELSFFYHI